MTAGIKWLFVATTSPFGMSSDMREYLPMALVILVGGLTGWLYWKIKKHAS